MPATQTAPLTIDEYAELPDNGTPTELVRGRVIELNVPYPRHGWVCANAAYFVRTYLEKNDIGRVFSNDSGVITERDPDTMRGADVCFYSYDRLPRGPLPQRYIATAPDLVFEVLSTFDRLPRVLTKVGEYLTAGVRAVCVLDPDRLTATVYRPDQPEHRLEAGDALELPDILPGFSARVERFFT